MKYLTFAVLLLSILAIAGCTSAPKAIKIGYIGPLSGPSSVLGMDAIKAIETAADEINTRGGIDGMPVRIIAEDDQYNPSKTLSSYEKLVNTQGVRILLVSTYGGIFTIADRAKDDGVIVIDPLDCNSELAALNENVFCLATQTESIGTTLADHLISKGKTKAGLLYSTKDSFMALVAQSFKERFAQVGGRTVEESFAYIDQDFKTQLLKLGKSNPDALVFLGHDETGIAMKQARELGSTALFMATGTVTSPSLQQVSGGAAEGTIFAYWESRQDNTLARAFEATFVQKVGRPPILPLTTHPAYDAMLMIKQALPGTGGRTDAIRNKLYAIRELAGTTGDITMPPDGGVFIKESTFILKQGKPVKLD